MEISDDEEMPRLQSFPPLRLYEDQQARGKWTEWSAKRRGDEIKPWMRMWRDYRNRRFYQSLIGFHKGELDLSGRHQERYDNLKSTWDEYLSDFRVIEKLATPAHVETEFGDEKFYEVEYTFSDPCPWNTFIEKWHISTTLDTGIFTWTERVLEAMSEQPKPKIQSLCLHHLPIELIQQVYELAPQAEARVLSSASRYMRSLALPYIFGTRTLQFGPGLLWFQSLLGPEIQTQEEAFKILQAAATSGRDTYIDTLNFILSRPDLVQSLTSLSLLNLWATTNITNLRILGLEIDESFVRVTVNLPSLVDIAFEMCSLTHELQTSALIADFPKYERVLNLTIRLRAREGNGDGIDSSSDEWYLIPLCPRMKTLAIGGLYSRIGIILPPEELWDLINPFKTVERFSIQELIGWQVDKLGGWIRRASGDQGHQIKMTHFKVQTKASFDQLAIEILVDALSFAPDLEVCVLDGITSNAATVEMIQIITSRLPNLLGLTLLVNDQWQSSRSPLRAWPSPMWAYGSRFSAFTRLEYFGWNNRFDPETSPAEMIFLEEGFPEDTPKGWAQSNEIHHAAFIWDFERTGAVFGAFCPSLKYVALAPVPLAGPVCSIERIEGGQMIVTSHEYGSKVVTEVRMWNTPPLKEGWPHVLPEIR